MIYRLFCLALLLLNFSCKTQSTVRPSQPIANNGKLTQGPQLYAQYCAQCHSPLASTNKPGRTAQQIANAIAQTPQMQTISLDASQIQAIADALSQ